MRLSQRYIEVIKFFFNQFFHKGEIYLNELKFKIEKNYDRYVVKNFGLYMVKKYGK